jgi:hypothetical protein
MKWMFLGGVPALVAGGVYFHGPLVSGETYAVPATEAARVLETLPLPAMVEGMIDTLPGGNFTRAVDPGKSVTYFFHARGGQAAKFVATLQPVDAGHTRINTAMTMSGDAESLLKTQYMPLAKQFEAVGAVAMREQIDAKLEHRPFNQEVTKQAMMGFAMANMGAIQKSASEAMDAAVKLQDAGHAGSSYTPPPGMPSYEAGRPMLNPNAPPR